MGQRDGPAARVAAGLREEPDRLDRAGNLQPRLLPELAPGGRFDGLVHLQEAAGNRPLAGEWLVPAADQQHAERLLDQGEDHQVDRDHRAGGSRSSKGLAWKDRLWDDEDLDDGPADSRIRGAS